MRDDVTVVNSDTIIQNLSDDTLLTVCVDDSTLSDLTNLTSILSHVFIGPNTPDTSSMQEFQLNKSRLSVFAGPLTYAQIKTHYPVSVSLIDQIFHPRIINEAEINLLENAVGSRGLISIQEHCYQSGQWQGFGKRGKGVQSGLSPTKGPGMSDQSQYYR